MTFLSNVALAFEHVVREHPDRVALLYPTLDQRVTYRELHARAREIAGALSARGAVRGDVVAIFNDKSPAGFASMLACLTLGVTYANLDPGSPWARIEKMLRTCEPRLVVQLVPEWQHRAALEAQFPGNTLGPDDLVHTGRGGHEPDPATIGGGQPAYIMFTSGSTGAPKGAVISHANLVWFMQWARDRFTITADDVLTNVNPLYFDNSVFDFYAALFSGATLVPVFHDQARDPRTLVRIVSAAQCTVWFSVPSMLVYLLTTRALAAKDFTAMRKIVFGGEGFPKAKLKQLWDLFGSRADLENVYGPTECTCICSAHRIVESDFEDMQALAPLGLLAQNFDYEILPADPADDAFGELFLRGPHVGLGYYNDAGRTAAAFTQNPRHARYLDLGYRTGDLVRRDSRGWLHFKGRKDYQVKHMGYRIELEEIEAALAAVAGVKECAVVYQKLGEGLGQIVGFAATDVAMAAEDVTRDVGKAVPDYMVPRRIVFMDALPKNANGKIDRVRLQAALDDAKAVL
jgi:D-alanine--poly(phosphoribitol) ligase subunit 1